MKLRDSLTQSDSQPVVFDDGNVEGSDSDIEEIEESKMAPATTGNNVLADFVTKVPEADEGKDGQEVDLHR